MFESLLLEDDNTVRGAMLTAALFSIIGIGLSHYAGPLGLIGEGYEGLLAVLLITIGMSYPLVTYIRDRDAEELQEAWDETSLLSRHLTEIQIYATVFFTTALVFAFAYQLLPSSLFSFQSEVLAGITGQATSGADFFTIVPINLQVMAVTFLLSLLLAGGLVFVLVWNASVLGVHVGGLAGSLAQIPVATLPYLAHGFLEVSAFALAGIAGSLLSLQVEHFYLRKTHERENFIRATLDAFLLIGIAIIAVLVAGVIETGYPFV